MPILRKGFLFVALCSAIGASAVQTMPSAQGPQPTFSIKLNLDKRVVKVGSEVRVQATVTNTSSRRTRFDRTANDRGELEFAINIHDDRGGVPPLTEYGRALINHERPVIMLHGHSDLQPGETFNSEVVLTELYDLSPGKYTIQLERLEESTSKLIKSNEVTVTVTS